MSYILTEVSRVIPADVGDVWGIISAWGSERLWLPGVTKSTLEGFGVGAIRTITIANTSSPIPEKLEAIDAANHTIRYRIFNDDVNTPMYGNVELNVVDEHNTQFIWVAETGPLEDSKRDEMAEALEILYNASLDAISAILATDK
ncbi:putative polyketide cyclase dehydrase protein [Ilyonectria robusta]